MKKTTIYSNLIIHLFAFLHAAVVLLAYYMGFSDEILLTIFTILMIVLICIIHSYPLDLAAILSLLFCFAGFFLGTKGLEYISNIVQTNIKFLPNIISTFIITELIGWATFHISSRYKK